MLRMKIQLAEHNEKAWLLLARGNSKKLPGFVSANPKLRNNRFVGFFFFLLNKKFHHFPILDDKSLKN